MLSDPTFSNIVPREKLGPAVKVAENWFVELKGAAPGANPAITHPEGGGLELRWDAPVERVRVWQPLDPQSFDKSSLLDVKVTVSLAAGADRSVEWIAILEDRDGTVEFHTKFKIYETLFGTRLMLHGLASGAALEPDGQYRFCIQFSKRPNHVILGSVEADASPSAVSGDGQIDDPTLSVEQLKSTLDADDDEINPAVIEHGVRKLCERNDRESLLRLMEFVGGITKPVDRAHPLRTYVINYYARTMLNMNASETAYVHFKALLANPLLVEPLSDEDMRRLHQLLARACMRTGRVDEAREIHRELVKENPLDWEPYFHLGMLQPANQVRLRRLYHGSAEKLAKQMPSTMLTAIAESFISEGAPDEALQRALRRLRAVSDGTEAARDDDRELNLTVANAWLAAGDSGMWLAYLQRYFGLFDLAAPDMELDSQHILHMRERPAESGRSGPLVTVIMTSFNAAETLEYAARSVLNQSHGNLRLVIVDDLSEDSSREVIERLATEDDRVVPMFNDTNMGTYCSKNRALREFESDYYTFHDSDDWMHPERVTEHLAATRDQVRFTTSMWIRLDNDGRVVVRAAGGYLHDNPASTFFGAEVREAVGFFDSVRTGADSEFTWRARHILGGDAIGRIRKPLALGLNRTGSLTRSGPAAFDRYRFSPVRLKYWESWAAWHNEVALHATPEDMYLPYPLDRRRFEAPAEILPEQDKTE